MAWARPTRRLKPLRQRIDLLIDNGGEIGARDGGGGNRGVGFFAVQVPHFGDEAEKGKGRHFRIGRRAFGQIADRFLCCDRLLGDVMAANRNDASVGRQITGDHLHRRRFAGAIGAQKPQDFALRYVE